MHLRSHFNCIEFHIILELVKTIQRHTIFHDPGDFTKGISGPFIDNSVDFLIHLFCSGRLLETNSTQHVFDIVNVWQLLVQCLHLVVLDLELMVVHLFIVQG